MYEDMKAFSKRTGFTYATIRVMCIDGSLPYIAIGRRRMIPVERALEALRNLEIN